MQPLKGEAGTPWRALKAVVACLQGFHLGDSAKHEQKKTWRTFFAEIERCKNLEIPWTLQLRDPLANSFVSSVLDDPRKDPRMQVCINEVLLLSIDMYCTCSWRDICSTGMALN